MPFDEAGHSAAETGQESENAQEQNPVEGESRRLDPLLDEGHRQREQTAETERVDQDDRGRPGELAKREFSEQQLRENRER